MRPSELLVQLVSRFLCGHACDIQELAFKTHGIWPSASLILGRKYAHDVPYRNLLRCGGLQCRRMYPGQRNFQGQLCHFQPDPSSVSS